MLSNDFKKELRKLIEVDELFVIPLTSIGEKVPLITWRSNTIEKPTYDEVLDKLIGKGGGSERIAIKCGIGSGSKSFASSGLVCWDLDTKYNSGFDAILFKDLREIYPDLYSRIRIEKTPSGGFHLIYRVGLGGGSVGGSFSGDLNSGLKFEDVIKNGNIASRYPTEEESLISPKKKSYCFIECKAEGGQATSYPTSGYLRIKGDSIPTFTLEEHNGIYRLFESYDEIVEIAEVKPIKKWEGIYINGSSPWEVFNKSVEAGSILADNGWILNKKASNSRFDLYARNGTKEKNVGASFNKQKGFYTIFTTNSEIEGGGKCYSPAMLLCNFKYGGIGAEERKKIYEWLVSNGYGSLKPEVEKNIIKKISSQGGEVPKNLSSSAKVEIEREKEKLKESYPYGTFWEVSDTGGVSISRERLYIVSRELGFRKNGSSRNKGEPCWINGFIVKNIEHEFFFDYLKGYIKKGFAGAGLSGAGGSVVGSDLSALEDILNCYESFLQVSGKFTISRLDNLDEKLLLKSSKYVSYKFFKNCYIRITGGSSSLESGIEVLNWDSEELIGRLVWNDLISNREFKVLSKDLLEKSLYYSFVSNAVLGGFDDYLKKCIGFYCHDYRDQEGYGIVCLDRCERPEEGGGSGKNLFCSLLGISSTYKSTPGGMVRYDSNLLQSWDYQRILGVMDVPKGFDYAFFKDIITDKAPINKKYINEFDVSIEDMCKIIFSSNFSFSATDGGLRRRLRGIEFTDFYTIRGSVGDYHGGKMFPKDWTDIEYCCFDNIVIECIKTYLDSNCKIEIKELSDSGWIKHMKEEYTYLYEFFSLRLDEWVEIGFVTIKKFTEHHLEFCKESNITKTYSPQKINNALKEFCIQRGIEVDVNASDKINSVDFKGKKFKKVLSVDERYLVIEAAAGFKSDSAIDDDVPF